MRYWVLIGGLFGLVCFSVPFEQAFEVRWQFEKEKNTLLGTLFLKPGFHVYGPGETIGKPLWLEFQKDHYHSPPQVILPKPKEKKLPGLGKSIVFEKQVNIKVILKPKTNLIRFTLHIQVCTDQQCDRPRALPVTVAISQ